VGLELEERFLPVPGCRHPAARMLAILAKKKAVALVSSLLHRLNEAHEPVIPGMGCPPPRAPTPALGFSRSPSNVIPQQPKSE
jgi:hypothetical protein